MLLPKPSQEATIFDGKIIRLFSDYSNERLVLTRLILFLTGFLHNLTLLCLTLRF